jgi:hypothetical protein
VRLIYIAGKIQAETAWEREQNIRQAEEAALAILKLGAAVHCPHTMCRYFDGEMPWEEWIMRDLEVLGRCNAIFMCANWRDSKGATAEHDWAKKHGMKILYGLGEVAAYLKEPYPNDHDLG